MSTTGIAYYQISGEDTVSYNSTNKTLTASVQATLTNGNTTGSIRSVTIPADLAYNAGHSVGYSDGREDGAESVTVDSVTQYSYSSTGDLSVSIDNGYLRYNNGQLVGRVNIALDGNDNTATCVVSMDGQRVVDDAKPRSIVRRTNQATGAEMPDTWDSTTNKGYIYLRATTNNGEIYVDQNIEVGVTSAIYIAGQNSDDVQRAMSVAATADNYNTYYRSVNPSAASLYTVGNFTYGLADITLVNGTTRRLQFRVPAISSAVASGSVLTTTQATYGQYDSGFNFGLSGNLYTSGNYQYGRIAIKNAAGTTLKTIRVVIPASSSGSVTSITVARPYGDMRDWDLSEENHVYVNVNLSALNGSTVLATDTGRVKVDDIVNFWAPHQTTILATTSVSDSNNYDLDVDTTGYTNAYFKSGNYQYVRFQLQNADGNGLGIVRVKTVSTDMSISEVSGLTSDSGTYQNYNRQVSFVASSLYTPSGSSTQYARVQVNLSNGTNEVIRVALPASASGSVTRADYDSGYYSSSIKYYKYVGTWPNGTGYVRAKCGTQYGDLDVTSLVMEAIAIGQQQGSSSSVTVRSVKATSNKTYDSNMDMYYVMVRVTYSDGSWQNFQAWYD